jgi:hypothetical protein
MSDCVITRYHGDTWELPVAVTDALGVAIPLTGGTLIFRLETKSTTVADFYFADPITVTPNTVGISIVRQDVLGTFTLTLTDTLMSTLSIDTQYQWDITLIDSLGVVLTLVVGTFSVEEKAID